MEQKTLYVGIAVGILVVLGILFVFWPRTSSGPGAPGVPGAGTVVLNFGGMPIDLRPVEGQDVECVGAPDGYTMVHFADQSDEYGKHITVGYAREGDDLDGITSWARSRASTCGFQKVEETSGAIPGAHGISLHYQKNEGDEELFFDIAVLTGSDGKEYTVVRVGYDRYYEDTGSEGYSSAPEESSEQPQEVPVSGDLKAWDDTVRPILEQVFGSVTLTSAAQPASNSVGLDYVASRAVVADDAQKLVDAFVSAGWTQMTVETSGEHFSLGFQKGNAFLGLDADVGGDTIPVVIYGG